MITGPRLFAARTRCIRESRLAEKSKRSPASRSPTSTRGSERRIPATAISYAAFGDSVFVIEKKHDEKTKQDGLVLRQQFIRTGETRGDFVAVTKGLNAGEQVASTGVFKLRNGASVVIDNKMAPNPKLNPTPPNT